ncbi:hypothetical protein BD560DRAFT_385298 [Blakeslea trispora]|nr:hypothetical protein BD560DRAFT_385298 [Blakeslea trispora]
MVVRIPTFFFSLVQGMLHTTMFVYNLLACDTIENWQVAQILLNGKKGAICHY